MFCRNSHRAWITQRGSLCHALGQSGRAKIVSEQEKNGEMRREPISIFLNTAKRPLPRPLPENFFFCQNVRRCDVGGSHMLDMWRQMIDVSAEVICLN